MKKVSALALIALLYSVSVTAWAEDSAGGSSESGNEVSSEPAAPKPEDQKPKPTESSAEPGCSD